MIEKYNSAYDENHSKLTYILRVHTFSYNWYEHDRDTINCIKGVPDL